MSEHGIVRVYPSLEDAEAAVKRLSANGFPINRISIVTKSIESSKRVHGFIAVGDAPTTGATSGAWMGGMFGLLLGAAFVWVPGLGPLFVAGPFAAARLGMHDICSHRRVALSQGRIVSDCIECPLHGFQYDGSGRSRLIPANGKGAPIPKAIRLDTYPVHEAHGLIAIWWGEPRDPMPAPPYFEALDESFSTITVRDQWAPHYSRAIENQLDQRRRAGLCGICADRRREHVDACLLFVRAVCVRPGCAIG